MQPNPRRFPTPNCTTRVGAAVDLTSSRRIPLGAHMHCIALVMPALTSNTSETERERTIHAFFSTSGPFQARLFLNPPASRRFPDSSVRPQFEWPPAVAICEDLLALQLVGADWSFFIASEMTSHPRREKTVSKRSAASVGQAKPERPGIIAGAIVAKPK